MMEQTTDMVTTNQQKEENMLSVELIQSTLTVGREVKNYKMLCELLDQPVKSGASKRSQLKEFKRYFDWERAGQKFVIADIYDMPLAKEDGRMVYVPYIEIILLQYLLRQENYTCTMTKRNWWECLGLINSRYGIMPDRKLQTLSPIITSYEIGNFYQRCNNKLERILFTALRSLASRKLIIYEMQTVIFLNEEESHIAHIAGDNEKKKILEAERYVLHDVMGYNKMFQVYLYRKNREYYDLVKKRIKELYDWDGYYKQIKIIHTPQNTKKALSELEIKLQKEQLNSKVVDVINMNAQNEYDKRLAKYEEGYQEECKKCWGTPNHSELNIFKYPDTYVQAQRLLTEELINIGHENTSISIDAIQDVVNDEPYLTFEN